MSCAFYKHIHTHIHIQGSLTVIQKKQPTLCLTLRQELEADKEEAEQEQKEWENQWENNNHDALNNLQILFQSILTFYIFF